MSFKVGDRVMWDTKGLPADVVGISGSSCHIKISDSHYAVVDSMYLTLIPSTPDPLHVPDHEVDFYEQLGKAIRGNEEKDSEPFPKEKKCTCPIQDLMARGCTCKGV